MGILLDRAMFFALNLLFSMKPKWRFNPEPLMKVPFMKRILTAT
ncbi:hypothetical protein [Endobacterium cereale]|nr:hypothetical protein [Endobacterium cereale]MEB2846852.1 hypothetical protein [Endobacterium cereale]